MTDTRLLSLLHFGDSAFPTGGYAHSFGLETYCQAGLVRGREDLERFLLAQLEGSSGPCDATAAVGVLLAAARQDLGACHRLRVRGIGEGELLRCFGRRFHGG